MSKLNEQLKKLSAELQRSKLTVYGAQSAFYFVISAVPFFMLLLSLVRYVLPQFMPFDEAMLRELIEDAAPFSLRYYLLSLFDRIYSGTSIRLVSFTAVVALYAASRGVYALMQGLDVIHDETGEHGMVYQRLLSLAVTLLILVLILVTLLAYVFGKQILGLIIRLQPQLEASINALHVNRVPVVLAIVGLFMFLYAFLPSRRQPILHQLPGAVFSTLIWFLFSFFYSIYIDKVARNSVIYGSLGAVVFMMFWLYWCLEIFLAGALINKWAHTHFFK